MNGTGRRLATLVGATAGILALLTGTASAHFCRLHAPVKSQITNGQAWFTGQELTALIEQLTADWTTPECLAGRNDIIRQVQQATEQGYVFMGSGLLAGGTIGTGRTPSRIEHLDFSQVPENCPA